MRGVVAGGVDAVSMGRIAVFPGGIQPFASGRGRGWSFVERNSAMPHACHQPAVFGPFDGDFDPFEDEEEFGVLIVFGRGGRLALHTRATDRS
jgi:hypothetical protein